MNFEDTFDLDNIIFKGRKCRTCGITKSLTDNFYVTRKDRQNLSAYSYECKKCTIERVTRSRKESKPDMPYNPVPRIKDVYPDW